MNSSDTSGHQGLEILDFWFREISPRQWFGGGQALDHVIEQRFLSVLLEAIHGNCDGWSITPRGRLALIILLDQFSRHIYRDTASAFAQDTKAQQLCVDGIETGMDKDLTSVERHFFYMPLMHAESHELQALSVEKFTSLQREATAVLGFASGHASIIERFGRFPHRNKALGRGVTSLEEAFLESEENHFK